MGATCNVAPLERTRTKLSGRRFFCVNPMRYNCVVLDKANNKLVVGMLTNVLVWVRRIDDKKVILEINISFIKYNR